MRNAMTTSHEYLTAKQTNCVGTYNAVSKTAREEQSVCEADIRNQFLEVSATYLKLQNKRLSKSH